MQGLNLKDAEFRLISYLSNDGPAVDRLGVHVRSKNQYGMSGARTEFLRSVSIRPKLGESCWKLYPVRIQTNNQAMHFSQLKTLAFSLALCYA
jgi:hypothetical protein